jgi:hypothetical protein
VIRIAFAIVWHLANCRVISFFLLPESQPESSNNAASGASEQEKSEEIQRVPPDGDPDANDDAATGSVGSAETGEAPPPDADPTLAQRPRLSSLRPGAQRPTWIVGFCRILSPFHFSLPFRPRRPLGKLVSQLPIQMPDVNAPTSTRGTCGLRPRWPQPVRDRIQSALDRMMHKKGGRWLDEPET